MRDGESLPVGSGTPDSAPDGVPVGVPDGCGRSRVGAAVRRVTLLLVALVVVSACASKGMPPAQRAAMREAGANQEQESGSDAEEPDDPEKAKKEITDLYLFIFDGSNPEVDGKIARVNKGESVRAPFVAAMTSNASTFSALTARVDSIEFTSPTAADVTFTLSVSGVPTLEGFTGKVVYQGGQWMMEPGGMCDLVSLADASLVCQPG